MNGSRRLLSVSQDEQPPFRFANNTDMELEVGLFLPQPDAAGGFGYPDPGSLVLLAPNRTQESAMLALPDDRMDGEAVRPAAGALPQPVEASAAKSCILV